MEKAETIVSHLSVGEHYIFISLQTCLANMS